MALARRRIALLHLHARILAHELSNTSFLAEIQSRQQVPTACAEIRTALRSARRLARLLADGLSPDPKRRSIIMTEAKEEIETLLILPNKGQLPEVEVSFANASLARLSFIETPPSLLLIVQDLLLQAKAMGSKLLRLSAGSDGSQLYLEATADITSEFCTKFVTTEAKRSSFSIEMQASCKLRVILPCPQLTDLQGLC